LAKTVDFTVTGLTPGSTILELDAPMISKVAPDAFEQKDFWREVPESDDTALDLAAFAIRDVERDDSSCERYDASVLEAVMEFQRAVREEGVRLQLIPKDVGRSLNSRIPSTPGFPSGAPDNRSLALSLFMASWMRYAIAEGVSVC
jgi:hypothetical protein